MLVACSEESDDYLLAAYMLLLLTLIVREELESHERAFTQYLVVMRSIDMIEDLPNRFLFTVECL